jgi:hypothetical protein
LEDGVSTYFYTDILTHPQGGRPQTKGESGGDAWHGLCLLFTSHNLYEDFMKSHFKNVPVMSTLLAGSAAMVPTTIQIKNSSNLRN